MLVVTGIRTTIVDRLRALLPECEEVHHAKGCAGNICAPDIHDDLWGDEDRYLFAQGLLRSNPIDAQTADDIIESMTVNLVSIVQMCEWLLAVNDRARICVIGSESGYRGSYDMTYAVAKAGLHGYVEMRRVGPRQQLVGVAPSMILDSGMTERRVDQDRVKAKGLSNPKGRGLYADEVAKAVHFLLYVDQGYINNVVIRIDGGVQ